MNRGHFLSLPCFAVVAFTLAGCAGNAGNTSAGEPGRADELRELAMILPLYSGQYNKGPSKVADLTQYEAAAPLALRSIKNGDIVVVWGATMPGEGDIGKGTTEIVAYEKKTPTEGGAVLLHNGTVKEMTAEEFKSASQAKK